MERIAETMVRNWRVAREVARVGGADFVAVLQPVASQGAPRVDHLQPKDFSKRSEQSLVYPVVRRILAESGEDWFHDFTDIFDGDQYIFIDSCHATANGTRLVAERVDGILSTRLRAIAAARKGGAGQWAAGFLSR